MAAKQRAWKSNHSDHQRTQVGLERASREASESEDTEDSGVAGLVRLQFIQRTVSASSTQHQRAELPRKIPSDWCRELNLTFNPAGADEEWHSGASHVI